VTDLSLLLLVLVLIEAFVIIRFELRFEAYLRTVQAWTNTMEQTTYAVRERVARVETLTECRARRECANCDRRPPDA